jgi:Trk K+ transport system NAD-binding subunit
MIGVASLFVFVLVALLVTRVATVALRATGLSHETARFQARSAFSGVGFTTSESEDIVNHPVRRNIVLTLMLLSTAGIVTSISALLLSFVNASGYEQVLARAGLIFGGLGLLWALASSDWVEAWMSRVIERALTRWTDLDVHDYVRLLEISGNYSIAEVGVDADEWLCGRRVGDLQLAQEGVVVLGIRHADGHYVGAPPVGSSFEAGDILVLYGRSSALDELQDRKAGAAGDLLHERAMTEHSRVVAEESRQGARRALGFTHDDNSRDGFPNVGSVDR